MSASKNMDSVPMGSEPVTYLPLAGRPLAEYTLPCMLETSSRLFANRPAIGNVGEDPFTYSELYLAATSLGQWLSEQGLGFGDRVAIVAENCPQWAVAYFAITCMGGVAVPILTEFHPDAVSHIIRHSEAKAVFVSDRYLSKIEERSFDLMPICIDIETFTLIELGLTRDKVQEMRDAGLREFRKWREKAKRLTQKEPPKVAEDDVAAIIYTSGTTGHSKGVQLTHKNIVYTAATTDSIEELYPEDRFLSILPLAHTYECTLGLILPITNGCSVTFLGKPPTARIFLPALQEVKPTIILTVPLIMEKIYKSTILPKIKESWLLRTCMKFLLTRKILLKSIGKRLIKTFGGSLRAMVISGAPLTAEVEKFLYDAKFPYMLGYGMTETSPTVTAAKVAHPKLGSSGKNIGGVLAKIDGADPRTGIGEIMVKGPNVMKGYYKLPELDAEVFTDDGWLKTGDLGIIDEEGHLYIRGRLKNMILGPSGKNIYPEEIESFFFAYPFVSEVLVYSSSDGRVTARIHMDANYMDLQYGELPPNEIRDIIDNMLEEARMEVNSKLSSFARINRIVEQIEPFEKTPTQKIKRYLYIDT